MTTDIALYSRGQDGLAPGTTTLPELPRWSGGGAVERRARSRHELAIRQEIRGGELDQVRLARQLAQDLAQLDAAERYVTEVKFKLEEAERRSRLIAGDDPVLNQQFAVLDATLFQAARAVVNRRVR